MADFLLHDAEVFEGTVTPLARNSVGRTSRRTDPFNICFTSLRLLPERIQSQTV